VPAAAGDNAPQGSCLTGCLVLVALRAGGRVLGLYLRCAQPLPAPLLAAVRNHAQMLLQVRARLRASARHRTASALARGSSRGARCRRATASGA
jgi:hypothetical protein